MYSLNAGMLSGERDLNPTESITMYCAMYYHPESV